MPAAGLFDVLEHINDDVVFLKELNSLIVSGGGYISRSPLIVHYGLPKTILPGITGGIRLKCLRIR